MAKAKRKERGTMGHIWGLMISQPVRTLYDSAPWVKFLGTPLGALLAFLWGEVFVFLAFMYCATFLWDWFLAGQLARRRTRRAIQLGEDPDIWGGFDSEVARAGLLVKISLLIQIGILYVGELWLSQKLDLYWTDILPSVLEGSLPASQIVVVGPVLLVAAILNELRSCERNRRLLGGRALPLFSHVMDRLDQLAERLVPPSPEDEGGWHRLPPPPQSKTAVNRLRGRHSRSEQRRDDERREDEREHAERQKREGGDGTP